MSTTTRRATARAVAELLDAGFRHIVLAILTPYPQGAATWVAEELIEPSLARYGSG